MANRPLHIKTVTQQLRVLFKAVQAHSKHVEKQCGLSSAKLWMLHELNSTPGIKVSKLAMALTIHPSTCSNMLDKLEEDGFVCKERSKADQRAVHISLTEKGRVLLKNAPQPTQGELSGALEKLSEEDLVVLVTGLEKLVQALSSKNDNAALFPIPGE
jgi:MarR family transcriptional regulator, organic hydroperoxide resistance regulator